MLEAYRSGVLSASQLGPQLQGLGERRSAAMAATNRLTSIPPVGPEDEKAIRDYCAEAAANLASFSREEWQALIRSLIKRIVFDGENITIEGLVTASRAGQGVASEDSHLVVGEVQLGWTTSECAKLSTGGNRANEEKR